VPSIFCPIRSHWPVGHSVRALAPHPCPHLKRPPRGLLGNSVSKHHAPAGRRPISTRRGRICVADAGWFCWFVCLHCTCTAPHRPSHRSIRQQTEAGELDSCVADRGVPSLGFPCPDPLSPVIRRWIHHLVRAVPSLRRKTRTRKGGIHGRDKIEQCRMSGRLSDSDEVGSQPPRTTLAAPP
jgi:hypothetical protein